MIRGGPAPFVLALAFALGACTNVVPDEPAPPRTADASLGRQILVTVSQDSSVTLGLVGNPSNRYIRRRGYGPAPDVDRIMDQIAREHRVRRVRGWPIASLDVYCEVFEAAADRDIESLLRGLNSDPRVELAQRMNLFETQIYNDTFADLQTSVTRLDVEDAHRLATGRGVTVAVIDSQVDWRHPDLRGRIGISRDFVDGGVIRAAAEVHGTAVAGIIASVANNTEGIVGIAPDVELEALRACWAVADAAASRCSTFSLAQALEAALQLDADVINLSLTGPEDPLLAQLLDTAIAGGIVIVAAVREAAAPGPGFPASHPGVIAARSERSVAAGEQPMTVNAPGSEILTTTPSAGYAFFSGNSLAAAHVSGVIALLLEREPRIGTEEIVQLLSLSTVNDGLARSINACRAVARLVEADLCLDTDTIAGAAR